MAGQLSLKIIIQLCMQAHLKLLGGLTKLHMHGISPPVTADRLNGVFWRSQPCRCYRRLARRLDCMTAADANIVCHILASKETWVTYTHDSLVTRPAR